MHQPPPKGVVIGRSGVRQGLVVAAALLAGVGILALLGVRPGLALLLYMVVPAVVIVVVIVVHRSDVVVLAEDCLAVVTRSGTTRYRWADLLEVGWIGTSDAGWVGRGWPWVGVGAGPAVRPRGGPYAVPGPNAPRQVATLAIFGHRAQQRARDAVREACRRKDVPFSDCGARMLDDPPPTSPFRDPR